MANYRKAQRKISVMFWGCITMEGVGFLTPVDGYITGNKYVEILEEHLWPVIAKYFAQKPYIFMDDNAPVHRARIVMDYLQNEAIPTMQWPPQSPDLNPVENIWRYVKQELKKNIEDISNKRELIQSVMQIWNDIPEHFIKSLYYSLPKGIAAVLKMKGLVTKY